eukprot:m.36010 g.36010  ORF g.36010 m.36010 type:complete len:696 (-) comp5369_c0_seq1:161-2248(-)
MEVSLTPVEYMQAASLSAHACAFLSSAGHRTQKVVVGDHDGTIMCFGAKKGSPVPVFQQTAGGRVSCVQVYKEKIFVGVHNQVKGYSRKGKLFFEFAPQIAEPILAMGIYEDHLHLAYDHKYFKFENCQETASFASNDRILDMILVPVSGLPAPAALLACADHSLRLMTGSAPAWSVSLQGRPQALALYAGGADGNIVFGTACGRFGLVTCSARAGTVAFDMSEGGAGVTAVCSGSFMGEGLDEIVLGRADGTVQVYSMEDGFPSLAHTTRLPAAIASVATGLVGSSSDLEVIVTTCAGSVTGLVAPGADSGATPAGTKITALTNEITELQQRLASTSRQRKAPAPALGGPALDIRWPEPAIYDSFVLIEGEASYLLSIELHTSIETVVLQSDVPVDVLDSKETLLSVSFTDCRNDSGNQLLATYTCQPGVNRLQVKIRTIEGHHGTLVAYITPAVRPLISHVRQYPIRALSLHHRAAEGLSAGAGPINTLTLTGAFSLSDIHGWLALCLPDLPEKAPKEVNEFSYRCSLIDTRLECAYQHGQAVVRTDSLSALSIVRDVVTQAATLRNCLVSFECDVDDQSAVHVFRLLFPLLQAQNALERQVSLLAALRELSLSGEDAIVLPAQYQEILDNADRLQADFKRQPCQLERLYGMITDLYIDKFKFQGVNAKSRTKQLMELLERCHEQDIVDFFNA